MLATQSLGNSASWMLQIFSAIGIFPRPNEDIFQMIQQLHDLKVKWWVDVNWADNVDSKGIKTSGRSTGQYRDSRWTGGCWLLLIAHCLVVRVIMKLEHINFLTLHNDNDHDPSDHSIMFEVERTWISPTYCTHLHSMMDLKGTLNNDPWGL